MLSLALLLITFYGIHLFLKWFLSNKRGRWATIVLFILHRAMYLMIYLFNWSLLCLSESRYCFVRLLSSGRLNCEEWNEGYLPDEYIF